MDCRQAKDLLSAYYDQELSSEVKAEVARHLTFCDVCAAELASFDKLSAMSESLSDPVPQPHIWDGLEAQLHAAQNAAVTARQPRSWLAWTRQPAARFALASVGLLLIAIGWFGYGTSSHDDEHQMAAVFGQYLDQFQVDPRAAQEILLTNYESHAVAADEAIQTVGYRPLVANGLPTGYSLLSTHVMKMPCCTCVQCLCQRDDGTVVAIFEHDDEEPHWYGDRASRNEVCGGKRCSLVELDGRLAATWQHGSRHVSVVGARNIEEVSRLVQWFGSGQYTGNGRRG